MHDSVIIIPGQWLLHPAGKGPPSHALIGPIHSTENGTVTCKTVHQAGRISLLAFLFRRESVALKGTQKEGSRLFKGLSIPPSNRKVSALVARGGSLPFVFSEGVSISAS